MSKPNILFILTDQHSIRALGCYGNRIIRTPNLDALASESTVFDAAYTASPICGPARGSMFTGRYPAGHGAITNWTPLKAGTELLTDRLAAQGYTNGLVGKLHLYPGSKRFGFHEKQLHDAAYDTYCAREPHESAYAHWLANKCFDGDLSEVIRRAGHSENAGADTLFFWKGECWVDEAHHDAVWAADEAIAMLRRFDRRKPFFLNLSFFGPHQPYAPPPPWDTMYCPDGIDLPPAYTAEMTACPVYRATKAETSARNRDWGERGMRELMAAYYGHVSLIDRQIGRVFDELRRRNLWNDTLIVFSSDHGDLLGDYALTGKGCMYEGSARVPLIVKAAGNRRGIPRCDAVVNNIDLFGTFLDAACDRTWRQAETEARSILPLVSSPAGSSWQNRTFSIIGSAPRSCLTLLRRDRWKLIRLARENGPPLYELFDLDEGRELHNRFDDPAAASFRTPMQAEIDAWYETQTAKLH